MTALGGSCLVSKWHNQNADAFFLFAWKVTWSGLFSNFWYKIYDLSCWTQIYPAFANSVDPDQLASEEANWSGSALFVITYLNLYEQLG